MRTSRHWAVVQAFDGCESAEGTFYENWGFKTEVDFADEEVALADVYVQYLGFDPIIITAGHYKQPFSLENMNSANDITFMERALTESGIEPVRNRLETSV